LAASGEELATRQRHLEHFLALAEWTEAETLAGRIYAPFGSARQVAWLARLEREHGNLRAAVALAQDRGDAERLLRLTSALNYFWIVRGHVAEGLRWMAP